MCLCPIRFDPGAKLLPPECDAFSNRFDHGKPFDSVCSDRSMPCHAHEPSLGCHVAGKHGIHASGSTVHWSSRTPICLT
jgi:hypothetical protein